MSAPHRTAFSSGCSTISATNKLDCRHNELRRLFPGVTDNTQARAYARSIAGWKPLSVPLHPVTLARPRRGHDIERVLEFTLTRLRGFAPLKR